jgi:hypothetical protein
LTERPAWQALLAPLPPDAVPKREAVAPPEVLATPEGAAIAGWDHVVLHLSDPCRGLRTLLVVIDAAGTLLSAGDSVFVRIDTDPPTVRHESIGGRFEPDGTFRGAHWVSVGPDLGPDDDSPTELESTRTDPTPEEVAALRGLVDEMLRRQTGRS